jgi:3'(2'), 5'-bisphosphate nucleotidase
MFDHNQPEINFALYAVHQAALIVSQVQKELISPALTKDDRSPVTVADFAAQAVVARLLAHTFPLENLVAEENAAALRQPKNSAILESVTHFVKRHDHQATPERVCDWIDHNRVDSAEHFWTLDPIDGTKGFLRGEQYAVALALVVGGQVQVGVLGCPNLEDSYRPLVGGAGSLVVGVRGQGAWTAPLFGNQAVMTSPDALFKPLRVAQIDRPGQARILRSVESGHTNLDQIDRFAAAFGVTAAPLSMDSQAKYAVLAAGQGDLYLRLLSADKPDYREKIWDQAAGSIIIEEAGGKVTDLHGHRLDFTTGRSLSNNRGILASNSLLHPSALAALRQIGA